jgi:hypothetical protein
LFDPFQWILYGSVDGVDHDVVVRVTRPVSTKEAQVSTPLVDDLLRNETPEQYSLRDKPLNTNFCVANDGIVTWCYKGTPDELNNSILAMYEEHKTRQKHPNFVTKNVPRDTTLKILRAFRVLICSFSRSNVRHIVEPVLKNVAYTGRLNALQKIDFHSLEITLRSRDTLENIWKLVAFQMGQTLALVEGVEVFSKRVCADRYPALEPFLYRHAVSQSSLETLNAFKNERFLPATDRFITENVANVDDINEFDYKK